MLGSTENLSKGSLKNRVLQQFFKEPLKVLKEPSTFFEAPFPKGF